VVKEANYQNSVALFIEYVWLAIYTTLCR